MTAVMGRHRIPAPPGRRKRNPMAALGAVLIGLAAAGAVVLAGTSSSGSTAPARTAPEPAAVLPAPLHGMRPPASPGGSFPAVTYTVAAGDSLWSIAREQCGDGTRYAQLATANHLVPLAVLPAGKVIVLACG